jgi:DNA repair protein RecN (Recombination protein N)
VLVALAIRDFAIVDRLDLEFEPGFTALTGETGAGKSLLIDALALALGERADPSAVRAGAERAEVTAEFALERLPDVQQWLADGALEGDPGRLLLRRVVERGGRSRAFVNGTAATAQQLAESEWLIDIPASMPTNPSRSRRRARCSAADSAARARRRHCLGSGSTP